MEVLHEIKVMKGILEGWSQASRVGHSRSFISPNETERIPDMLTFYYREVQFFLKVRNDRAAPRKVVLLSVAAPTDGPALPVILYDQSPAGLEFEMRKVMDAVLPAVIPVTREGDHFVIEPGSSEETEIPYLRHGMCSGYVDRTAISETYQAFHCRKCSLRVLVPVEVSTIGQLRAWAKDNV